MGDGTHVSLDKVPPHPPNHPNPPQNRPHSSSSPAAFALPSRPTPPRHHLPPSPLSALQIRLHATSILDEAGWGDPSAVSMSSDAWQHPQTHDRHAERARVRDALRRAPSLGARGSMGHAWVALLYLEILVMAAAKIHAQTRSNRF